MEPNKQKINWRLLITVAKGDATAAERMQFERWLHEAPEQHQLIFQEIERDYAPESADEKGMKVTDTATAFSRMMAGEEARQHRTEETLLIPSRKRISFFPQWRVASVAALLFILVGTGFWLFKTNPGFLNREGNNMAGNLDWQEVTVAFGRQVNLTLNDGSLVRLAPGTKFRYPTAFGPKERNVYLEGEAFFEVSRDTGRPFIVQTHHLKTQVLGTSFNIEAFREQAIEKVVVVTGKVSVSKTTGNKTALLAYLTPNRQIEFNSADEGFDVSQLPVNIVSAIKSGKLVFDGSTLQEIGEAIQRRYGVEVHFSADRIARKRLTTMLDYSSIDNLANMLRLATGLNVRHKNGHLYFSEE